MNYYSGVMVDKDLAKEVRILGLGDTFSQKYKQSFTKYYKGLKKLILKEGTALLYIGDEETISQAYDVTATNNEVFLPHVMSRKKQIVPRLSELWG